MEGWKYGLKPERKPDRELTYQEETPMRIFLSLLGIFVVITLVLTILGYIVGGPVWTTPAIVSLLVTAFIWLGLIEATQI